MNANVIELDSVSKTFRQRNILALWHPNRVLENINLTVRQGEFVALRGKSGVGKTTLLYLILGLLTPSSGKVKLMGLSPKDANSKLRVSVVFQETQVPRNMKVKELIELRRSYSPNSLSTEEILTKVNLTEQAEAWATDLAGGQKQRLYFALALVGNPELLVLDEPTRNLDIESYDEFWRQIELCQQQGMTILMVTHNKSDWEKLNQLATRIITLHKVSEAPSEGQLSQEVLVTSSEIMSEPAQPHSEKIISEVPSQNILGIFWKQLCFESLQLLRTPSFLLATLAFAAFLPLLKFQYQGKTAIEPLVYLCGIILFTVVIERLGKRLAIERSEGWLKLLKATSLPPTVYIAAKVTSSLLVCAVGILWILVIGQWQLNIEVSPGLWIALFLSLIIGIVPFAILGLALGYLLNPKDSDPILGFSLVIVPIACGVVPLPVAPGFMQDLISLSPFYHYRELVLWAAGLDYDRQLFLHLLWLVWAWGVFGLIAVWAYQRDRAIQ
jgi:ABC-2 type transport system ATP-binding protein